MATAGFAPVLSADAGVVCGGTGRTDSIVRFSQLEFPDAVQMPQLPLRFQRPKLEVIPVDDADTLDQENERSLQRLQERELKEPEVHCQAGKMWGRNASTTETTLSRPPRRRRLQPGRQGSRRMRAWRRGTRRCSRSRGRRRSCGGQCRTTSAATRSAARLRKRTTAAPTRRAQQRHRARRRRHRRRRRAFPPR